MKKLLVAIICSLTMITGLASASLFVMQSAGAINVIADEVKVVFRNYDNSFLWKGTFPAGSNVTYGGEVPQRPSNEMYEYTFISWDKSLKHVTEDTIYYAQYQNKLKEYRVSFQNWNHKELYVDYVSKGQTAEYVGAVPVREPDEHYSYVFSGWDKPLTNINQDTVITAEFEETPVEYEVTFKNGDKILYRDHVAYLGTATYRGLPPIKESTETTEYVFTGWDKPLIGVATDFETQAVFEERPVEHTVSFYNYDSTFLYETHVSHGGTAVYMGSTPYREPEGPYSYVFNGWNRVLTNVQSDFSVIAQYQANERQIPTHFYNYDGTYLYTAYSLYGKPAYYGGEMPYREEDDQYIYEFDGWDRDISYITDETITYATYRKELRTFKCVFKNFDGEILYTTYVHYGDTAVYIGDTPVKNVDVNVVYKFIGWNKDLKYITEDTVFYAEFEIYTVGGGGETKYCEVDFYNYDGELLDFDIVEKGTDASYEWTTPTRPNDAKGSNYRFVGWDQDITNVQEKILVVFALYETDSHYIVSYRNKWFDLLYEDFVYKWETVKKSSYRGPLYDYLLPENDFLGWDKDLNDITGSMTTYPVYPEIEEDTL